MRRKMALTNNEVFTACSHFSDHLKPSEPSISIIENPSPVSGRVNGATPGQVSQRPLILESGQRIMTLQRGVRAP